MIKKLFVSNYALIDRLEMEPSPGMTILTGETGAGKSIILGALGLATGARADLAALRDNTRKCVVELSVEIDGMDLEGFFAENDLDYEPLTILRREILPSGKSRAFVNDTPVLLDTLGRLAGHLLDVHSSTRACCSPALLSAWDWSTVTPGTMYRGHNTGNGTNNTAPCKKNWRNSPPAGVNLHAHRITTGICSTNWTNPT